MDTATLGNAIADVSSVDIAVISQQLALIYNALRLLIFLNALQFCKGVFTPLLSIVKKS